MCRQRNDGEVFLQLGVVPRCGLLTGIQGSVELERLACAQIGANRFDGLGGFRPLVGGSVLAIGAGVGRELVGLVERLGGLQHGVRRVTHARGRLLQLGQAEQQRGPICLALPGHLQSRCLATAGPGHRLRVFAGEEQLSGWVELWSPLCVLRALPGRMKGSLALHVDGGDDAEVVDRYEVADLVLALNDETNDWGHHAPEG